MQQLTQKQKKILKFICNVAKETYKIIQYMKELIKNVIKIIYNIIKLILIILLVFSFPFILPSILNFLIKVKWFNSLEEFNNLLSVFFNKYVIIYLAIGILLFLSNFGKIEKALKNIASKIRKIDLDFKGNKISASWENDMIQESAEIRDFSKKLGNIYNPDEDRGKIINYIKKLHEPEQLGMEMASGKKLCEKCDTQKLKEENNKLRNFATYNIMNRETKMLLHIIYNEKYIETERFKNEIIKGYKKKNKRNANLSNKNINKLANNKYETILNGLKFLNIIVPSENDNELQLTSDGKKFVEEYIEDKGEI